SGIGRVLPLQGGHVQGILGSINKRPDEASLVKQVDGLRRGKDVIDMPGLVMVWREEFAHENADIKDSEKQTRNDSYPVALELPPPEAPLRSEVDALLRRRQPLDRLRIEGLGRNVMLQRSTGRRQR